MIVGCDTSFVGTPPVFTGSVLQNQNMPKGEIQVEASVDANPVPVTMTSPTTFEIDLPDGWERMDVKITETIGGRFAHQFDITEFKSGEASTAT